MDILTSLLVVAFAALIHASFQLSVSVLTLLSGHAIGSKKATANVLRMTTSFVTGAAVMTILLVSFTSLVLIEIFKGSVPLYIWAIVCGLTVGIGVGIWAFYYRREQGTALWIPRAVARYLSERTKQTTHSSEAFGLGLTSVLGELLFIIAPIAISALVLIRLPAAWQLVGIALYAVISLLSLVIVWVLIGSGHKLSTIQRWRESNKYFMQFAAGSGLLILGFFVYVSQIVGSSVGGS
jgi:hypothetical protein